MTRDSFSEQLDTSHTILVKKNHIVIPIKLPDLKIHGIMSFSSDSYLHSINSLLPQFLSNFQSVHITLIRWPNRLYYDDKLFLNVVNIGWKALIWPKKVKITHYLDFNHIFYPFYHPHPPLSSWDYVSWCSWGVFFLTIRYQSHHPGPKFGLTNAIPVLSRVHKIHGILE